MEVNFNHPEFTPKRQLFYFSDSLCNAIYTNALVIYILFAYINQRKQSKQQYHLLTQLYYI